MAVKNNEESNPSKQYKIILMDCNMPIMDGYCATKKLVSLFKAKKLKRIPIIACTADASKDNIKKCEEMGFL